MQQLITFACKKAIINFGRLYWLDLSSVKRKPRNSEEWMYKGLEWFLIIKFWN